MEEALKFEQYRWLAERLFNGEESRFDPTQAGKLHPLVLAHVGDAYFSLYCRLRLLVLCPDKVRIIHSYSSKIVSATYQAQAMRSIEDTLTEEERQQYRRGRNAKSSVPRSATVADYRASTGFEALLGHLFLTGQQDRLQELCDRAFAVIAQQIGGTIVVD